MYQPETTTYDPAEATISMFVIEERQSPVYPPKVVSLMSENGQTGLWGSLVNVQPDP